MDRTQRGNWCQRIIWGLFFLRGGIWINEKAWQSRQSYSTIIGWYDILISWVYLVVDICTYTITWSNYMWSISYAYVLCTSFNYGTILKYNNSEKWCRNTRITYLASIMNCLQAASQLLICVYFSSREKHARSSGTGFRYNHIFNLICIRRHLCAF